MKKILPIEKNVLISSECWTFYKFSVMQTTTNFNVWLASHMKIYMDQNCNTIFGENGTMYPLSYYGGILDVLDGHIMSIDKNDIINYLMRKINEGKYIIIDLNYPRMCGVEEVFWLHETLIYGYDDESCEFVTQLLTEGGFREYRISFKMLKAAFADTIRYYNEDRMRLVNRRMWFYGVTCIKPNADYHNSNAVFDFINKLKFEIQGNVYKKYKIFDGKETEEYSYATGITCLLYLASYVNKIINDEKCSADMIKKCGKSCMKIYENHNIIKKTLEWIVSTQNCSNKNLEPLVCEYESNCEVLLINVRRFYKYQQNNNKILLIKIIDDLKVLYSKEKNQLKEIIEEIINLYSLNL